MCKNISKISGLPMKLSFPTNITIWCYYMFSEHNAWTKFLTLSTHVEGLCSIFWLVLQTLLVPIMWASPTWTAPPLSSSERAHQVLNFLAVLACSVSLIVVLQYRGGAACFLASRCFLFCCREIKTGLRNAKETFPLLFILCDSAPDPMSALC